MSRQIRYFLSSLSFLSILPAGQAGKMDAAELAKAVGFFPAAGLVIGLMAAGLAVALQPILPDQVINALLVLFTVVVSGGLHLDALADTVDGLLGGHTPAQRLEIMRDGSTGPFGVAAVTLSLLLKYTLLNSLTFPVILAALMVVSATARWPLVALAHASASARAEGLGHIFAGNVTRRQLVLAGVTTVFVVMLSAYYLGARFLLVLTAPMAVAFGAKKLYAATIGGVTGDSLGATVDVTELFVLLIFLVLS